MIPNGLVIKVKKTEPSHLIKIPLYQSDGASGFDLCAFIDRSVELGPNNRYTFNTGLCFEIPEGFELQIRPRSGLAFVHGVMTSFGTIDSDYRGEVKINLMNTGRTNYTVAPGERIAQGVICPVVHAVLNLVNELSQTPRDKSGFGSTGSR